MSGLTLALTKGRILDEALPLLERAGIRPLERPGESRKLLLDTDQPGVRLLILRGVDVPTYVQQGAADLGIVGRDLLLEHGGEGLYEPLDLGIARCRLMTAGPVGVPRPAGRIRVATKYAAVARRHYAAQGRQADIVKLWGAMELAPLLGLADEIVDIVDTGRTLRAHGLEPRETIAEVSSRVIVNRAAMKLKHRLVRPLLARLAAAREEGA
ncbi:MAG: ATP phosphoribosyltransferase [Porticoccaceae bacterium]|nr:MAG: ATP phosphoribosyltransferase [Porticoccaceae bacterium]